MLYKKLTILVTAAALSAPVLADSGKRGFRGNGYDHRGGERHPVVRHHVVHQPVVHHVHRPAPVVHHYYHRPAPVVVHHHSHRNAGVALLAGAVIGAVIVSAATGGY